MKKLLIIFGIGLFSVACGGSSVSDANQNSAVNKTSAGNVTSNSAEANRQNTNGAQPGGRKYAEMSEAEKRDFIAQKAQKFATALGNQSGGEVPAAAVDKIKAALDSYSKRLGTEKKPDCRIGDNLQATFERAAKNVPAISQAFKTEGVEPQIGIYLAMIESEHCACVQSPTGPLGLFQLTRAMAEKYGLAALKDATSANPDDRCRVEPASRAAAKHLKSLLEKNGAAPAGTLLSIVGFNSGSDESLTTKQGVPKEFWPLVGESDKLSAQLQMETFLYLPKFFAAAIIGENPAEFGLTVSPLSTSAG